MHPLDILKYGDSFMQRTLAPFPKAEVYRSGACGRWSVKDLVAHLGSFELVLEEVLGSLLEPGPTPLLELFSSPSVNFNDSQVDARQDDSYETVLAEYQQAYVSVLALAAKLPPETWTHTGLLAWYGAEYDLEDFIVYSYYGHKREHCGQIQVFSDQFK
jgi:hypothetical protein